MRKIVTFPIKIHSVIRKDVLFPVDQFNLNLLTIINIEKLSFYYYKKQVKRIDLGFVIEKRMKFNFFFLIALCCSLSQALHIYTHEGESTCLVEELSQDAYAMSKFFNMLLTNANPYKRIDK
jgi:hypothetical protein